MTNESPATTSDWQSTNDPASEAKPPEDHATGEDGALATADVPERAIDALVREAQTRMAEHRTWSATYRIQFTGAKFRFNDARELAEYLGALGVSHLYSSPNLQTRPGSAHGYDIVDHQRLNRELGTDDEFRAMTDALHEQGIGQLLDIVPNHMCVGANENAWWFDVLMNGPASRYAGYFDIDWQPTKQELAGCVLLPVLDDRYGNVLEAGRLRVKYAEGAFVVDWCGLPLPLDPQTWKSILAPHIDELEQRLGDDNDDIMQIKSIITALEYLPGRGETAPERVAERSRERLVIQGRLRALAESAPAIAQHIERNVTQINGTPGDASSFDALDRLLEEQAYHLVHWKAGSDELNYRRFFDVTELAAVCTENIEVFTASHALLMDMVVQGRVDGFRVDHIDGLLDPMQYLWRLQWQYVRAIGREAAAALKADDTLDGDWESLETPFLAAMHARVGGPEPTVLLGLSGGGDNDALPANGAPRAAPLFVVAEKILGADEPLPPEWPIQGTTGYDFLNLVNGLFVDRVGLREIERHYQRFTQLEQDFREVVYDCKRVILGGPMQSEVQLLAHRLDRLSQRHRRTRDFTLQAQRSAIREIMAYFPVYRTYIRRGEVSERDRRVVNLAVAQAKRRNPAMDAGVFDFVRDVLLLEQPPDLDADGIKERDLFVGRFQQVTSPVMAKGVEDTAFYRYVPLCSLDEVGGEPLHAVKSIEEFHRENIERLRIWPRSMLATTTHDTKRTEDVRARINVLSEIPGAWRRALQRWTRWNRKHRRDVEGKPAPSRNDEWLFYQTLVGIWPVDSPTSDERGELIERLRGYMEKATHEAKLHTSWISPNAAYDEAVRQFVTAVLSEEGSRFDQDLTEFLATVVDPALYASASQVLLKTTSPGIPDTYQGQELWDFSLVDPDNRRKVDFDRRRWLLGEVNALTSTTEGRLELARHLAQHPRDDRYKLLVTRTALDARRQFPQLFNDADYVPLAVEGARADYVCAYARVARDSSARPRALLVAAPRFLAKLRSAAGVDVPCGPAAWGDTAVVVGSLPVAAWRNLFTEQTIAPNSDRLFLATLTEDFPSVLLCG